MLSAIDVSLIIYQCHLVNTTDVEIEVIFAVLFHVKLGVKKSNNIYNITYIHII